MNPTVLIYESSVLRTENDLWVPVPEVGARVRAGQAVVVVVSAVASALRRLTEECRGASASSRALLLGTADRRAAALVSGTLSRCGIQGVAVDPADIDVDGLIALLSNGVVVLPRAAATDRLLTRLDARLRLALAAK